MKRSKVLITGASSGLGKALAYEYHRHGYDLVLIARNEAFLKSIQKDFGEHIAIYSIDLTTKEGLLSCYSAIHEHLPDIVINNAGIGYYGEFSELPLSKHEEVIQLNISTLVEICHIAIKAFITHNRKGIILNVSSTLDRIPCPLMSVYAATKAFVTSFSQSLDYELQRHGISVLCSSPGQISTDFRKRASFGKSVEFNRESMPAELVAKIIYEQVQKKQKTRIIDWRNKIFVFFATILPRSLVMKILYNNIKYRL